MTADNPFRDAVAACALYALATYDPAETPVFDRGPSQVFVFRRGASVVLAARGSTDLADWAHNLRALPRHAPELGCRVHGGFLAAYRQVRQPILDYLAAEGWPPVLLTGHSAGGALMTLLAAELAVLGKTGVSLVTFGAPRVGWGTALTRLLAGVLMVRLVNGYDLVTRRPAAWTGYRHPCPAVAVGTPNHPIGDHDMVAYHAAVFERDYRMAEPKHWLLSRGITGGIVALAASFAAAAGVDPVMMTWLSKALGTDIPTASPDLVQALTAIAGGGGAMAIIGRLRAQAPIRGSNAAAGKTLNLIPALLGLSLMLALSGGLTACGGVVMPGPVADITARSPLAQVASGRANLNAGLAAGAVYIQSGQATGALTDTVRDLSASAAAAVDKADAAVADGASQTVVTVIMSAAHRDLRDMLTAMAKQVRGSILSAITTASIERGIALGSNVTLGATAIAQTRLAAWEAEDRDPTAAELAALQAETAALLAIIRGD